MPDTQTAPSCPDASAAPAFPLLAYLDGLMEELRGRVPVALNEWDSESIHQSRVATRRIKAALDLMRPILGGRRRRRLAKLLSKLRHRLGPLRDADVMLQHLQQLGESGKFPAPVGWMSQRISSERDRLRQRSAKRTAPADMVDKLSVWLPVREEILAAREAADSLLAESLHLQLDAFAEQADPLAGSKPVDSSEETARPDPHALRIAGKALRYTLEMAVVQGHDLPGSLTKTFKKMQDALGLWHDYVVLTDRATRDALDEQLSHHQPELMSELFELIRDVLREAADELAKFKRLWAEDGESIARAIRTSFPLTRSKAAVTESKTDPGPGGSAEPANPADAPPAAS